MLSIKRLALFVVLDDLKLLFNSFTWLYTSFELAVGKTSSMKRALFSTLVTLFTERSARTDELGLMVVRMEITAPVD